MISEGEEFPFRIMDWELAEEALSDKTIEEIGDDEFLAELYWATTRFEKHPEGYKGPCMCNYCMPQRD